MKLLEILIMIIIKVNEVLAEELHKPVIKKFKRRKVYARLKDNIWVADLAEMGLLYYSGVLLKVIILLWGRRCFHQECIG